MKKLNDDFMSEENTQKGEQYTKSILWNRRKKFLVTGENLFWQFKWKLISFYTLKYFINVITKKSWIKEDKTTTKSNYPPLETIILELKGTEVITSPFKISTENEIKKVEEQNNYYRSMLKSYWKSAR